MMPRWGSTQHTLEPASVELVRVERTCGAVEEVRAHTERDCRAHGIRVPTIGFHPFGGRIENLVAICPETSL